MLDIRVVRENPEKVQQNAKNKGYGNLSVDELLRLDADKRELQAEVDELREKRNENAAKMKNGQPSQELIIEGKQIKGALAEREEYLRNADEKFLELLKNQDLVSIEV